MNMRDLIPWGRNHQTPGRQSREASERSLTRDPGDPFLTLHREMNRLFDDVFRGFDLMPFASSPMMSWPNLEVVETHKEVRVCAELPGLHEKDVEVLLEDGVLTISGEKRTEHQDEGRRFSERFYGRFVRQVPVGDVEEDQVEASFKDGVLTVTMPKTARAREKTRRIAINGRDGDTKH